MCAPIPAVLDFVAPHLIPLPYQPLPVPTGVYFLVKDGAVVYVGMTEIGARRPMMHLGEKEFDGAYFLPLSEEERGPAIGVSGFESAFIRRLKPPLNADLEKRLRWPATEWDVDLDLWYGTGREIEWARHDARARLMRARGIIDWVRKTPKPKRAYPPEIPLGPCPKVRQRRLKRA